MITKPNYNETLIEAFIKRLAKTEKNFPGQTEWFKAEIEKALAQLPKKRKHFVLKTIADTPLYINEYLWTDVNSFRVLGENTKTKELLVVEIERRFSRSIEYFGDQPDMIKKDIPVWHGVYWMKPNSKGIYRRKIYARHEYNEQGEIVKTRYEYKKCGKVTTRCNYHYDTGF